MKRYAPVLKRDKYEAIDDEAGMEEAPEGGYLKYGDCELVVQILDMALPRCHCELAATHKTENGYVCDEHADFSELSMYAPQELEYAPLLRKLAAS